MKINILYCILGIVLGIARVEGAFEEVKPLQQEHIEALLENPVCDPEEIKSYDLNEIYIAGALLSEGWGCSQGRDEKKALQLYQTALEVLRNEPMDIDIVWNEETLHHLSHKDADQKILPIFKDEHDQVRRPFVLYAVIGDTIRLLLRQGQIEEALKLMEESHRLALLKGKELEEIKSEEAHENDALALDQVVHFYETMLNDGIEEGYLLNEALFQRSKKHYHPESQVQCALNRNMLVGELVVRNFEQKPVKEKLKAFPFVLRNANSGIPQAMEAMHLYYKGGCGFLPSNASKAEKWLKRRTL